MSNLPAEEQGPCAVPLTELLRKIPSAQRLVWTDEDGLKATHYVPVGRYAHEAADEIERLRAAIYQACSDMGCYCADDDPLPENLKCPMCKLEKALHGSASTRSGDPC